LISFARYLPRLIFPEQAKAYYNLAVKNEPCHASPNLVRA
jgi:hypothetical protein